MLQKSWQSSKRMRSWFCIVLNTGGSKKQKHQLQKGTKILWHQWVSCRGGGAWMEGISLLKSPRTLIPTPPYYLFLLHLGYPRGQRTSSEPLGTIFAPWILPGAWQVRRLEVRLPRPLEGGGTWRKGGGTETFKAYPRPSKRGRNGSS